MAEKINLNIPLNRAEGDLEIRVELEGNVVTEAWCSGVMYRGFENVLCGRGPLDGLVITPRICGICSTSHLTAAARALDMIASVQVPPGAVFVRNLSLMTEHLQSDARQTFLMFAADFVNRAYEGTPLYAEALRRYEPLRGEVAIEVIRETKKLLGIISVFGGKWPHSSFMVPGGVTAIPSRQEIQQCRHYLDHYREWVERRVLGCEIDRWLDVRSMGDLDAWLAEDPAHSESELGFFVRFARQAGLDKIGGGPNRFISYGSLPIPSGSSVRERKRDANLTPAGFAKKTAVLPFDQSKVAEHIAHSWFTGYEGAVHPLSGQTSPYATGNEGKGYSWAKAVRYDGLSAETSPLAEMVIQKNPLFLDLMKERGASAFVRQMARIVRSTELIPAMEVWLDEVAAGDPFYAPPGPMGNGEGFGLIQGSRGALGHWVKMKDDKIESYQIITPSGWNFSPRDSEGNRGPVEEALLGIALKDFANPVELEHAIRSFDPCLVCTVHALRKGETVSCRPVGA